MDWLQVCKSERDEKWVENAISCQALTALLVNHKTTRILPVHFSFFSHQCVHCLSGKQECSWSDADTENYRLKNTPDPETYKLSPQNISQTGSVLSRQLLAMSSSSASVLPDVNTNQSLRTATLSISTHMHRTKWVFVSGGTQNRKEPKGSALPFPAEHLWGSGQTPHYPLSMLL